jgi:hypothetical protein
MRQRHRDGVVQCDGLCLLAERSRLAIDDGRPCRSSHGLDRTFTGRSQSTSRHHHAEPDVDDHDGNKPVRAGQLIIDDGTIDVFGRLLKLQD